MKHRVFLLTFALLFACSFRAQAQVAPSATGAGPSLYVGGELSGGESDYAGQKFNKKIVVSPAVKKLYGLGLFVDFKLNRWVQLEAEMRRSRIINLYGLHQNTAQFGLRVPIFSDSKARFIPYGKVLGGVSSSEQDKKFVYTLGGGCDYQLNKRIRVRLIDFEYQRWNVHPALHPYQYSMGVSFRVF